MGDRALIIITEETKKEVSPTIYLHWEGYRTHEFIEALKQKMQGRTGDVAYATARLLQIVGNDIDGNISLGCWNTPPEIKEAVKLGNAKALKEFSHGDNGVFVVNCSDFKFKVYR